MAATRLFMLVAAPPGGDDGVVRCPETSTPAVSL
jgi:hypothetical protein